MDDRKAVNLLYDTLIKEYGPQGWWPVLLTDEPGAKARHTGGYHPGSYHYPRSDAQRLEITIGAILTQNTNWNNAAKALASLYHANYLSIEKLLNTPIDKIALAIKSAGYYNQKARYLKNVAVFLAQNSFQHMSLLPSQSIRKKLLSIRGVGPETADCVLLYALNKPSFVVDAYTRRVIHRIGILSDKSSYEKVQRLFESNLERNLILFQEYHALLVAHGKRFYQKKPYGDTDWLLNNMRGNPERV